MKKILMSLALAVFIFGNAAASQHDFDIGNAPGAVVRADINAALESLATNNSGATAPAATYANMWWFDTSTNILKQRDNANTEWISVAFKDASGWIPYRQGTQLGDIATLSKDTDGTLAANSDVKVATQKAAKTYIDGKISALGDVALLSKDTDGTLAANSDAKVATQKAVKTYVDGKAVQNSQLFTSTGTFTPATGVTSVFLTMAGGGGGGGKNSSETGGGGSGAHVIRKAIKTTPGNNYTATVGAAGAGATSNGAGGTGGASSFAGDNVTISCNGGTGGAQATTGGAGGTASGTDYPGGNSGGSAGGAAGGVGQTTGGSAGGNGLSNHGGGGAGSPFGVGSAGGNDGVAAGNATGYGSGGGGGGRNANGGNGTGGMVYLEW